MTTVDEVFTQDVELTVVVASVASTGSGVVSTTTAVESSIAPFFSAAVGPCAGVTTLLPVVDAEMLRKELLGAAPTSVAVAVAVAGWFRTADVGL